MADAGGPLTGIRVVEVGGLVSAPYAGKLLADLGADVVKIEPPNGGDPARLRGPFPGDRPDPDASGLYLYLNTNKRGITLDLTSGRDRDLFDRLVGRCDVLLHNVHPLERAAHGLDYERLATLNPRLVMASIAPFGSRGPHARHRAADLVSWCAGGLATLNGDPTHPELPPLKAYGDQAGYQAGLNAAVPVVGALFERLQSGPRDLLPNRLSF